MDNWRMRLLFVFIGFGSSRGELAFANRQSFLSFPFQNPLAPKSPNVENVELKGEAFLQSLDLKSSREPKTFYTDPKRSWDIATATVPFVLRLGSGAFAEGHKLSIGPKDNSKYTIAEIGSDKQLVETCAIDAPPQESRGPLVLYEFEGCPFCRKVREAVSMLSLEVEFRPCPQDSSFRREIKEQYGQKSTFPFMMDPNTGVEMFESDDIIQYLFRTYGKGEVPSSLQGNIFCTLSAGLSLLPRATKGGRRRSSNPPELPLTLWSGEGSPFAKIVKEELCELQIVHRQISCPRGSPNRQRMFEKTGRFQIPYLEDPNTGVEMFESSAIIEYLETVYGADRKSVV